MLEFYQNTEVVCMNYDTIILELLSRIQKLEEEVKSLREVISYASTEHTAGDNP